METPGNIQEQKQESKKSARLWDHTLHKDESKMKMYCSVGKRKVWSRRGTAHELEHIISQTWWRQCFGKGMYKCLWNCVAGVFFDDVTAEG